MDTKLPLKERLWNYFFMSLPIFLLIGFFLQVGTLLKTEKDLTYAEGIPTNVEEHWSYNAGSGTGGRSKITFNLVGDEREFAYHATEPKYATLRDFLEQQEWVRIGFFADDAVLYVRFVESKKEIIITLESVQKDILYNLPLYLVGIFLVAPLFFIGNTAPARFVKKLIKKLSQKSGTQAAKIATKGVEEKFDEVNFFITNKKNYSFAIIPSLIGVYIGFTALGRDTEWFLPEGHTWIWPLLGYCIIAFFGYTALISLHIYFRRGPLLKIDKKGLYGYGGNLSFSFVGWEEITALEEVGRHITFTTQKDLQILLRKLPLNPLGWVIRLFSMGNIGKKFGVYPFNIDTGLFNLSAEEFRAYIQKYSKKKFS